MWKAPRARLPGRRRINTAATAEVVVLAVLEQGRHRAQHRRHDKGGGVGDLGARPPPRSTPPLSSWRRSFPGGATPCNALRKDRPEPRLDGLLVPLSSCGGDDCPQNLARAL